MNKDRYDKEKLSKEKCSRKILSEFEIESIFINKTATNIEKAQKKLISHLKIVLSYPIIKILQIIQIQMINSKRKLQVV